MGVKAPHIMKDVPASENLENEFDIEKEWNSFMILRGLSQHADTAMLAGVSAELTSLPVKMQYEFLRNIIRPKKRYGKWAKASKNDNECVSLLIEKHKYSRQKAEQAADLLTEKQIADLKKTMVKGGKA